MIVWPQINHYGQDGSWNFLASDGRSRVGSQMDNGRTRLRRRFSSNMANVSFSILLSVGEADVFKYFYDNVLDDGTKWFVMPVFDGSAYRTHLVRFVIGSSPQFSGAGFGSVLVAVQLEIYKLFEIDEGTFRYYSVLGFSTGDRLRNAIHKFDYSYWPEMQG